MRKLVKIMVMVLSGVMIFSQVAFAHTENIGDDIPYVISVSEGLAQNSVQFDGSKKKEIIEINLEQDMWYGWFFDNQTDNEVSITEIGVDDKARPVSHLSAGISGGIYPQKGSEPLKKGKYTFVIESLGENNLKGFFEYTFSSKEPDDNRTDYIKRDEAKLYLKETQPIVIYDNNPLREVSDEQVAVIWNENPDNEALFELQKHGIIEGDPNGDIRPYTKITRAEMAKVLCKALGLPKMDNGKSAFSDMTSAHWAYGYIETAYASGLIDGNEDGTFAPDNDVKFSESPDVVKTYDATPEDKISEYIKNGEFCYSSTHYEMSDGTWKVKEHPYIYKYRLELTGRLHNAVKDSTYIILSNTNDITFEQAWKASGLSSNTEDYFDAKDAIIVGQK